MAHDRVRLPTTLTLDDIVSRLPELREQYASWKVSLKCECLIGEAKSVDNIEVWDDSDWRMRAFFANPSLYKVHALEGRATPSKAVAAYVLSYILGMLVRYFLSRWISLLSNNKGDAAMPTLLAASCGGIFHRASVSGVDR